MRKADYGHASTSEVAMRTIQCEKNVGSGYESIHTVYAVVVAIASEMYTGTVPYFKTVALIDLQK